MSKNNNKNLKIKLSLNVKSAKRNKNKIESLLNLEKYHVLIAQSSIQLIFDNSKNKIS